MPIRSKQRQRLVEFAIGVIDGGVFDYFDVGTNSGVADAFVSAHMRNRSPWRESNSMPATAAVPARVSVDPSGDGSGQCARPTVTQGGGVEVVETMSDGERPEDRKQRGQSLRVRSQRETSSYGAAPDHSRFTPRPRQVSGRDSWIRLVLVLDDDVLEVGDQLGLGRANAQTSR